MLFSVRSSFFRNKFILVNFFVAVAINLILTFLIFLKISPTSEPITLHYNIYFGIDLIGAWYKVYFLPLFGLIVIVVNFVLAYFLHKQEKILSYFLVAAASLAQLILLVAGVIVVLLNI